MSNLRAFLIFGAVVALISGVVALLIARSLSRRTGFKQTRRAGLRVVASDTGVAHSVLLRDPVLGLRGRPDYLVEESVGGLLVLAPVEVKPTRKHTRLNESDEAQLAAYLVASRATFGQRAATFGYVQYAIASFRVQLTETLEQKVRDIVAGIRSGRRQRAVRRSHNVRARCVRCAVRAHCDEAL